MTYHCRWCGEPLRFKRDNLGCKLGWVHSDGKIYKTKMVPDTRNPGEMIEVNDHCVLPVPDEGSSP